MVFLAESRDRVFTAKDKSGGVNTVRCSNAPTILRRKIEYELFGLIHGETLLGPCNTHVEIFLTFTKIARTELCFDVVEIIKVFTRHDDFVHRE